MCPKILVSDDANLVEHGVSDRAATNEVDFAGKTYRRAVDITFCIVGDVIVLLLESPHGQH